MVREKQAAAIATLKATMKLEEETIKHLSAGFASSRSSN
jgi:hypothetical protein